MSEMRSLMLRSLDRIVADTLDLNARVAADRDACWPEKLWFALEGQGMTAVGETPDGDLGFVDVMALVQQAAFHAVPVPLGETILSRRLLARAGLEIPHGSITVAAPAATTGVEASGSKLAGQLAAVPWGRSVPHVVVAAPSSLILADISEAVVCKTVNMAGEPRDAVDLGRARLIAVAALENAPATVQAEGALLRAVQVAGALVRVLDLCLTWANDRIQFGKPIAKFQAIQHMLAQLAGEAASARAAAELGVEASVSAPDPFAIAIAKARTGEAAGKGAAIAHQAFGAMGFTREHQLHYSTRRLWSWRDEFGGEAYWQREIGCLVAGEGADRLWATLTERG